MTCLRVLLLVSIKLHRRRYDHVREELESDVVFGFLRSMGALVIEVPVSDVLVADVVVVVRYVIAAIDTEVAKVLESIFWRLACTRSSSGGGGSGACFFFTSSPWRLWPTILTGERSGGLVLATRGWAPGVASRAVMSVDVLARVLACAAVVRDEEP